MKLEHRKVSYIKVNYHNLERFATKIYNLENYSFIAVEECGNNSSHSFIIDGKIDEEDIDDVKSIRDGDVPTYCNYLLLNILCFDGHIEPGEYLINVSW